MKIDEKKNSTVKKVALLTSHPVQYQAPLFRLLHESGRVDLTVYFCSTFGVGSANLDPEFGERIDWGSDVLRGYRYKVLQNRFTEPNPSFWGQVNPSIVAEMRREHFDALIVYGWNALTNLMGVASAKCFGTRVFLRGENPLNQESMKSRWRRLMKRLVFPWFFRWFDAFLYIGEENRKFYRSYHVPDRKLLFCPYAVDNARFRKTAEELGPKRSTLREKWGIGPTDVVILFVGKLIEKKRPFDLLKAYQRAISDCTRSVAAHLVFVGSGVLEKRLKAYVEKQGLPNVHFAGFQGQNELPRYYAIADVFVLPSGLGETWGLVVNEAMNFGVPVIVSDRVGCGADLVHDGENGFVFRLGDVGMLAEYLKRLIENESIRRRFGERSRAIIQSYSYEKDVEGVLRALGEV